jgi:hypothetical protein
MTLPYFNDYLPETELFGRLVPNAFDVDEIMSMPQRYWNHFDWLSTQGIDMCIWTKEADICRHQIGYRQSWSSALCTMLRLDEKRRYLLGKVCPMEIHPEGYDRQLKTIGIIDRLKTDNENIERKYKGILGQEITICMPGKYWRYFDWIIQDEEHAQEYVTDADFYKTPTKQSISEAMMEDLYDQEERSYFEYGANADIALPLFISPVGHLNLRDPRSTRDIEDSKGNIIALEMYDRFWNYLDWLGKQGIDMVQWIKDLDKTRLKEKHPMPLYAAIPVALTAEGERRKAESETG